LRGSAGEGALVEFMTNQSVGFTMFSRIADARSSFALGLRYRQPSAGLDRGRRGVGPAETQQE
jgi:hypothetical protein